MRLRLPADGLDRSHESLVERFWQGDRAARIRLDKSPWTDREAFRKTQRTSRWLLIAVATGGALVFYFRDAPTLAHELVTGTAPLVAYVFLGIFTGTDLSARRHRPRAGLHLHVPLAAHPGRHVRLRLLLISYRTYRGEPRAPHREARAGTTVATASIAEALRRRLPDGHRHSRRQLSSNAFSAPCASTPATTSWARSAGPDGLIGYDTFRNFEAQTQPKTTPLRVWRHRNIHYSNS